MSSTHISIDGESNFRAIEYGNFSNENMSPPNDDTELMIYIDDTTHISVKVARWRQLAEVVEKGIADIPAERERRAQRKREYDELFGTGSAVAS